MPLAIWAKVTLGGEPELEGDVLIDCGMLLGDSPGWYPKASMSMSSRWTSLDRLLGCSLADEDAPELDSRFM